MFHIFLFFSCLALHVPSPTQIAQHSFSQKCYPILKAEMVIPATHEFISVRCRIHGDQGKHPKGPSQEHEAGTTNNYNNIGNNTSSSNTSKVYKDMMAFVPLKPRVEDRIRKYEEAKRKQVYSLKKAISNKIEMETNGRRGKEINTQQKLQPGSKDSRFYHHKELHSTNEVTNKRDHQPNQVEADGSDVPAVNQDRLSVLILGLDAQSHMNFIRQMPRSYTFLRKTLSAIGMQGYTKIGDNTFPNVVASLSGLSVGELEKICWPTKQSYFDSCPFIWKKFAESGYRTSLAEDSVWMATFNYDKKGFLRSPTDYYLHPLSLLMAKKIGHETWGNAKLCYGPRLAFEVLLDYIVKTAVTFKDSLYFQFVWSNSIFHDYLNYPKLGDILLESTMKFLFNNGFLNNTAFILLSDHGIRWGGIRSTYQGKIEERMPVVYFTFPKWFRNKYPHAMRNLRKNAMRLTTPYDVHETLQDILRLSQGKRVRFDKLEDDDETNNDIKNSYNKSRIMMSSESGESSESIPRGISLFREIPLSRTCRIAGVDQHWCVCDSMESVPTNSTLVLSGAQFIVQVINGLLKHSELCAKLLLFKINEAKRKIDGDIDRGLEVDFSAGKSERDTVYKSDTSQYTTTGGTDTDNLQDGNEILRENDIVKRSINPRFQKTDNAGIAGESKSSKTNGNDTGVSASIISTIAKENNASFTLSTSSDIKKIVQLQITLVTRPGDAVFEATIYGEVDIGSGLVNDQDIHQEDGERSHHRWKLAGDISRLNLYKEQSSCITDSKIAKYCFCTKYVAEE